MGVVGGLFAGMGGANPFASGIFGPSCVQAFCCRLTMQSCDPVCEYVFAINGGATRANLALLELSASDALQGNVQPPAINADWTCGIAVKGTFDCTGA